MINRHPIKTMLLMALALGGLSLLLVAGLSIAAQPTTALAQDDTEPTPAGTAGDSYCLLCHSQPGRTYTLPDGGTINVTVNADHYLNSVHGELGCAACHGDLAYPHETPVPASRRDFQLAMAAKCTTCHEEQAATLADGVHYQALGAGNYQAAVCVDCHGAHDVQPVAETPELGAEACSNCHVIAFNQYKDSVHGQALFAGDPNVPACIDCHGVHGINHPTTAPFRNRSPEMCAGCHGDKELMEEYGISTHIFDTYLSDFHGTTVELFEQQDPNVPTNKAVCYDCHGVHDIAAVDDANSRVIKENLLETCQQCHPDATSDFADAWVGHYEPTFDSQPLLYSVNLFYNILIPGVLAGFAALIGVDIYGRVRRRGGH